MTEDEIKEIITAEKENTKKRSDDMAVWVEERDKTSLSIASEFIDLIENGADLFELFRDTLLNTLKKFPRSVSSIACGELERELDHRLKALSKREGIRQKVQDEKERLAMSKKPSKSKKSKFPRGNAPNPLPAGTEELLAQYDEYKLTSNGYQNALWLLGSVVEDLKSFYAIEESRKPEAEKGSEIDKESEGEVEETGAQKYSFTVSEKVIALIYLLESSGVNVNAMNNQAEIARFIHAITGKDYQNIYELVLNTGWIKKKKSWGKHKEELIKLENKFFKLKSNIAKAIQNRLEGKRKNDYDL